MKRIILLMVFFVGSLFAYELKGTIEHIDTKNKNITVAGQIVHIQPYTEIEEDGIMIDSVKRFSDLKVGQLVEVDLIDYPVASTSNVFQAESIEIKNNKQLAY